MTEEIKASKPSLLKSLLLWLIVVITTIIIGVFLISIVYIVDGEGLDKNLEESKATFKKETIYHLPDGTSTSVLDNFTDSAMLIIASYRGDEPLLDKGMNNYRVYEEPKSPFEQMTTKQENPTKIVSYYRYWHGYVLFLRPLLLFFDYSEIRIINLTVQFSLLALLVTLMIKRKIYKYILPFLSAYILINPLSITYSLQNSTIWYIVLISSIIYLFYKDKIVEKRLHYILFTIVGMCTSFMDFLTYPIATLRNINNYDALHRAT